MEGYSLMEQKTAGQKEMQHRREYIVAKGNELILQTRFDFKLREMRMILYIISLIKPGDDPKTKYMISVSEFARICGLKQAKYTEIKNISKQMNKSFWIDNLYGDGTDYMVSWFRGATYNNKKGTLGFQFHEDVWPFLFALKSHYTTYPLEYILPMRSGYSIQLYEILKSQKERTPQNDYVRYDWQELQRAMGAKYDRWDNFKRKALEPAIGVINCGPKEGDINLYSDLKVSYRMEKFGRSVKYVIFHIMKKTPEELQATREYNQDLLDGDLIRPTSLDQVVPQGQMSMEDLLDDEDLLEE